MFTDFITANEIAIRIGCFFIIFAILATGELTKPRRVLTVTKSVRWFNNLMIVALDNLLVRLLFPAAAVGVAVLAQTQQWGLLHYINMPGWLAIAVAVIILDGVIYLQHVLFHAVPALWRLHRMHHADLDFDLTTGIRFHPVEIILSMLIKFAAIAALGASPVAVIIFEVALNATSLFNHSNIKIPVIVDKFLRFLVVTPDMHRVHHSVAVFEADSNFGFNFPWWDRLLGTYRAQPYLGHEGMTIGIKQYRDKKQVMWLPGMLWLPFKGRRVTAYAINCHQEEKLMRGRE